jgi:YjbE family integral membrane protein
MAAGGVALIWIAYRLLAGSEGGNSHDLAPVVGFWAAMRTIVIADAVMGLDNVLAVAGAAQGSVLLVVIGLLVSIPIVVWGSTLILHWIERFPGILYLGGGVLAWTAAGMVVSEPYFEEYFERHAFFRNALYPLIIGGVLGLAWLRNRKSKEALQ